MDRVELISELNKIKLIDNQSLRAIYNSFIRLNKHIIIIISSELYEKLQTELQCIYYESVYGDNDEDSLMVYNQFIEVLDEVINMI
jgi:hypothetical protein